MLENFALWQIGFTAVAGIAFNAYYWSILKRQYGRSHDPDKAWRFATLRLILFWLFLALPLLLAYLMLNNYFSRFDDRSTIMPMLLIGAYLLLSFVFQSVIMVRFNRYTDRG